MRLLPKDGSIAPSLLHALVPGITLRIAEWLRLLVPLGGLSEDQEVCGDARNGPGGERHGCERLAERVDGHGGVRVRLPPGLSGLPRRPELDDGFHDSNQRWRELRESENTTTTMARVPRLSSLSSTSMRMGVRRVLQDGSTLVFAVSTASSTSLAASSRQRGARVPGLSQRALQRAATQRVPRTG